MRMPLLGAIAAISVAALHTQPSAPVALAGTLQGTTLTTVASWATWCQRGGCGDSVRVVWRSHSATPRRTVWTRTTTDTLRLAVPGTVGSRHVSLELIPFRGRVAQPSLVTELTVRRTKPTPVDSYPNVTLRDTLGRKVLTVAPGATVAFCAFSKNQFTGRVVHRMPEGATPAAWLAIQQRCERARQMLETERGA